MPKDYLGDGIYAEVENGTIKLSTWDGISDDAHRRVIYLEPEVYHRLVAFVESIQVVPKGEPE